MDGLAQDMARVQSGMRINRPLQSPRPDGLLVAIVGGSVQFISRTTGLAVLLRVASETTDRASRGRISTRSLKRQNPLTRVAPTGLW